MLLELQKIICLICTFFMMIGGTFAGTNWKDTNSSYEAAVESVDAYTNTIETATPQTEVYYMIQEHFSAPLPEGKTRKKVLVIGYDGCRADALTLLGDKDSGAVAYVLANGGTAEISYCGGKNWPAVNTQNTSTAPGWCSMLTGQWADVHGIKQNKVEKSNDVLTNLTTLVEDGTIDSSAFYVSWYGHFNGSGTTYYQEKLYCEEKGLDVTFSCADDDDGTLANALSDIASDNCSDYIFTIFEHNDHTGHDTGFSINNPEYRQAFADNEAFGLEMIKAVEARGTYDTEDWLIIITSDHGGYNASHGNQTLQERMTFIVKNK